MNVYQLPLKVFRKAYYEFRMFAACLRDYVFCRNKKMVFLFGSPFHPNMGDQAQTYCILSWFKQNYPEYGVLIHRLTTMNHWQYFFLKHTIRTDDFIVCHSGYHLTNLYHEQDVYFRIIKQHPNHKVFILPQTVNYMSDEAMKHAEEVLNGHKDLTIFCRDEHSFTTAKKHFANCKLYLYPDIVTSLIGTKSFKHKRDGILFCMRNDKESFYKEDQINFLKKRFYGQKIGHTDTTLLQYDMPYIYGHREEILNEIFNEYSQYKVIITDRYHGTIFSQIAGTPVVVVSSTDHKLCSGVKWFPKEIFGDYITFAKDLDEAYEKTINILNNYDKYTHQLPPYFKEKYYDKLNTILE